ncbi:Serine/threonine-protein kinase HSL1 [Wickerhamiella sorbophila]|uniref:non-specific serine/threonine protein kinase n=1 Tax=Wickerhamiella sorbophila TaxID=45607 RepID=A0A2T0FI71_9ASCO|nr:Serine/threonine-protein kinase HSL1 [Wickerhamiella sorbophila]PRT54694.1 Serine/threonine-protein kinase HSL1 [Wickerhamiella sorbophila]
MDAIAAAQAATAGWVREQQTRQGTHKNRLSQVSTTSSNASKRSRQHIGPWQLGRTLGRGSSGRVRLAKHGETGQLAAVKIVPKSAVGSLTQSSSVPYGIEREVIIMKLIEHPNIMGLYDVWENKGELYLILEYIEGGELFDYLISRGRLPEREAVHYFRQICYGVDYCHQFNICHRDLKPENLLLDKHRNIKIADFGMAALETQGRMLETSCGSPHYASPEIVAGKNYHGAPSDIWSCGIILFALLTGHLPFDDDSIRKLLLKVQSGVYSMPRNLSTEAKDLISRMLLVDPNRRITMREILAHPLLAKYPYRRVPTENKEIRGLFDAHHPVSSVTEIDREILRNLQTLWHRDDSQKIIERLMSPDPNPEKTFYCLLLKYRQNHSKLSARTKTPPKSVEASGVSTPHKKVRHRRTTSTASHRSALSSRSLRSTRSIRSNGVTRGRANAALSHSRTGSKYSISSMASRRAQFSTRMAAVPTTRNTDATHFERPTQAYYKLDEPFIDQKNLDDVDSGFVAPPESSARATERTSRTSSHFADMLDQAFNFDEPRAVSATLDPVVSTNEIPERRTASEPTTATSPHTLDPRQSLAFDFEDHSTQPATMETLPHQYLLPMIFEEDRFADAIEEEVELKVHKRRRPKPISFNDDNSRLQISNLISGESFCSYQPSAAAASVPPPVRQAPQPPKRSDLHALPAVKEATHSDIVNRKPVPSALEISSLKSVVSLNTPSPPINPAGTTTSPKVGGGSFSPRPALADRSNQMNDASKPKESFLRRITPRRLRTQPADSSEKKREEPSQNWLLKMLNLSSSEPAPPGRVLMSTLELTEFQSVILEVMEEWRKFGLRIQHVDAQKHMISAAITRRNVLRIRQVRFTIQMKEAPHGRSIAEIARERGSRRSFLRFLSELDRVLQDMGVIEGRVH